MMRPSVCPPWPTDGPGQPARERNEAAGSYTTAGDTIEVALHNAAGPEAMVLDDGPIAVRLAILLPPGPPQKHDAENLAGGIRRGGRGRSPRQRVSARLAQDS